MVLYGIPDIRLFWSKDSGFISQFRDKSPSDDFKYKEISVHPQSAQFNDTTANVYDLIRTLGGDLIEQVSLTDEFTNAKKGLRSQTYRIVYRSHERALTKDEVNVIHRRIEAELAADYGVRLR